MNSKHLHSLLAFICLSILFTSFESEVYAQSGNRCNSEIKMQQIYDANPQYQEQIQQSLKEFKRTHKNTPQARAGVTIPVHVIIVHDFGVAVGIGNNLDLDRIESQIDVLNEDFTASNDDYDDLPDDFDGGNPDIEFCLASVDPEGFETDGVTRYAFSGNFNNSSVEYDVKEDTGWDRSVYLNIWVVDNLSALGWAYLPSTFGLPDPVLDGVVVDTGTFGGPGEATTLFYNLGRTTTHEVGHYLGLRHVWGNGNGGCGTDDGFDDTPIQQGSNFGCPNHPSTSCGNSGDFHMNYMDYVNDACMYAFSEEQSDYMNTILTTSRSSLQFAASTACGNGISNEIFLEVEDIEDTTCPDGSDGSILVSVDQGTPPYTFTLFYDGSSNPIDSNDTGYFDGLEADEYTITVEDANGATAEEDDIDVDEPNDINVSIQVVNEVSCVGASDGEVAVFAAGGNGDFEFVLPGFAPTDDNDLTNLAAGEYAVTIVDEEGCMEIEDFELDAPDSLFLVIDSIGLVSCYNGSDGLLDISADGGTGSTFTYMVIDSMTINMDTLFTGLTQDTIAYVAEDANGCVDTSLISIPQPDSLVLALDTMIVGACSGDSTATLILEPVGGNMTFTYISGIDTFLTDTLTALHADTFLITAIDDKNCQDTTSFIIPDIQQEELAIIDQINAECGGLSLGSITVESTSINEPTYTLDDETNTEGTFSNLAEGSYIITSQDTLGCEISLSFDITESGGTEVSIMDVQSVECFGEMTGSFTVDAEGSNELAYSIDGTNYQEESTFDNLPSGDYIVFVIDLDGCVVQQNVTIDTPSELTIDVTEIQDNTCANVNEGSAMLVADGGSGDFTYKVNGLDASESLSELPEGDYSVEVIDGNGCSMTTEFSITSPTQIGVDMMSSTGSACTVDDGTISISASGGTGNLTYTIDDVTQDNGVFEDLSSGNYTVLISDENDCTIEQFISVDQAADLALSINASTDETCPGENNGTINLSVEGGNGDIQYSVNDLISETGIFENLAPDTYQIVVVDAEGCSDQAELTINGASMIEAAVEESNNISCNGDSDGSIVVSASGGSGELTYELDGEINTNGVFSNLGGPNYSILVSDENGCSTTVEASLVIPEVITLAIDNLSNESCFGGSDGQILVAANGGNGDYQYSLNGEVNDNGMFEDLPIGDYQVAVFDGNECSDVIPFTIEPGEELSLTAMSEMTRCSGEASGSVTVSAVSGIAPFTYTIGTQSNSDGVFDNLAAGDYDISFIDANGCQGFGNATVEDVSQIEITEITTYPPTCMGETNGGLIIEASGGSGNYSLMINGTVYSGLEVDGLPAGSVEFTILDSNNCSVVEFAEIDNGEAIQLAEVSMLEPFCNGSNSGEIAVNAMGGSGNYTYEIDGLPSVTNGIFSNIPADTYTIFVYDDAGCSGSIEVTLTEPTALDVNTLAVTNPSCLGDSDASFAVLATGGTEEFTYTVDGEVSTDGTFDNLPSGDYQVIILDSNNCPATTSVTIEDPTEVIISEIFTESVLCSDEANGSLTYTASGGTGAYTYTLDSSTPQSDPMFDNLAPGDYIIQAIDSNGCAEEESITIEDVDLIDTTAVNVLPVDSGVLGAIELEGIGGTGDYSYSIDGSNYQNDGVFYQLEAGEYTVYIQDENSCVQEFDFTIQVFSICDGATEGLINDMLISPNPTGNNLNMTFCSSGEQAVTFGFYDDIGRLVHRIQRSYGIGTYNEVFDISDLPPSVYVMAVENSKATNHYRFIKVD